jgi:hypothetical protein
MSHFQADKYGIYDPCTILTTTRDAATRVLAERAPDLLDMVAPHELPTITPHEHDRGLRVAGAAHFHPRTGPVQGGRA